MPEPLFCPECRAEYLPSASLCVECDVALVAAHALSSQPVNEMPPASELVCIRASSLGWAQQLSDRLAAAGISHRVEVTSEDSEEGSLRRPGADLPFGVYVLPGDEAAAADVDAEFMRHQIPDLEPHAEGAVDADTCPACGTAAVPQASECPECGLALL